MYDLTPEQYNMAVETANLWHQKCDEALDRASDAMAKCRQAEQRAERAEEDRDTYRRATISLEAQVQRAEEALRFYADRNNGQDIVADDGDIARAALALTPEMNEFVFTPMWVVLRPTASRPAGFIISDEEKRKHVRAGASEDSFAMPDGVTLSREQFPELYKVITDVYGIMSEDEFQLPDLRNRIVDNG